MKRNKKQKITNLLFNNHQHIVHFYSKSTCADAQLIMRHNIKNMLFLIKMLKSVQK